MLPFACILEGAKSVLHRFSMKRGKKSETRSVREKRDTDLQGEKSTFSKNRSIDRRVLLAMKTFAL